MADEIDSVEVDAVVLSSGEVMISSEAVRHLALAPGQHLRVAVPARPRRRNMYGVLSSRLPDVSLDDIRRVRREVWGELAADP
jgi:hypothetical protein